jgi:hypothetical protein
MKFIKLNRNFEDSSIFIQPVLITCLEPLQDCQMGQTVVHMMNSGSWVVTESVDEIQKLIDKSDRFTITTS